MVDRRVAGLIGAALLAVLLVGWWFSVSSGPAQPELTTSRRAGELRRLPAATLPPLRRPASGGERAAAASVEAGEAGEAAEPDEAAAGGAGASAWPATATGIVGAIEEAKPDLARCYDEALAEVPGLAALMKVQFVLDDRDGEGQIVEVAITDETIEDGPMEECVLDVLQALAFDAPADGQPITVNYPLAFHEGR